jgi:hypothetical protein
LSEGLSITAYARHRGVSHVAVLKALKAGRIEKEPDGTIDPAKADAAWERNTNQAQKRKTMISSEPPRREYAPETQVETPVGPPIVNSGPSFAQSRAIKEAYNARLAKLAYEEKSGAMVRTDSVKVAWFNTLRVVRDRALNLPDRLAPLLAAETDPKIVRDLLEEELRTILNDAADAIANLEIG